MKLFSFLIFLLNAVLFSSLVTAQQFDPNNIEWLNIENWNQTDYAKLKKRANYDNQIKKINFYKGVDISSIISLENSGIRFYNSYGQQQDIFQMLKDVGVNCIRVRIWNNPKTTSGKTYGGGNNDLEVAREIGSRAARVGLSLFVDFHYSDFWADPGKQSIPKDWKNFNLDKRIFEIYRFTQGCLDWLLQNGSLISMVQIGNETTCFMCGDKNMTNVMKMMSNGAKAVRDLNRNILIALHFTNPNKSDNMLWYASQLASARVDYDVFATSYYPYWHGTVDNLKWILNQVANKYGKKVLIAEYAYPYTNAAKTSDNCSYGIIYQSAKDTTFSYPISIDGQSQCIRDMYAAIRNTKNGIGAFYWEPAWIAPKANNDWERRQIWEKYGSSWATTAAHEYDSSADSKVTGGTEWDNQAVFDQNGYALKSIWALGDTTAPSNASDNNNNNDSNNNNNNKDECFSIKLGYPCCKDDVVYYTDDDGKWGFENQDWCGIKETNQNAIPECTGKSAGYSCCSSCDVYFTDDDGRWGVENNEWCGIKNSC